MNPYIQDILSQPETLRLALGSFSVEPLAHLHHRLHQNEFDRILITGMGASYNAAYPAYLHLANQPLPVMLVNAAELLHYSAGLIGPRSLIWLSSQSGRSIEVVRLLENFHSRPPLSVLASVNDTSSPLASAANICLPIYAGAEATVSTRTYVNMLAVNLLAAIALSGGDVQAAQGKLSAAAEAMQAYLDGWQTAVAELDARLGKVKNLIILGRGPSLAAVWNGSLINKEAAKCTFEGMNSADFRHGPLELAAPDLTVLVFAGVQKTAGLNRELALEVIRLGGRSLWIAEDPDPELPTLRLPAVAELALPLVEILPLQMLTILMAQRNGLEAGKFRHVQKITLRE
ncbi:MAG TPA: SIS domain-containing protein [Anaerolineales bacterium]|nr:SIS domain-containing protein [Anaerolineales bacterium]